MLNALLSRLGVPGHSRGAPLRANTPPPLDRAVRRVLVTGASGRVGPLLLPHLQRLDLDLTPTDRSGDYAAGQRHGSALRGEDADLASPVASAALVDGQDAILHLAAVSGEASVDALYRDNSLALGNLLQAAARAGVARFVFASTMHVMGMYGRLEALDESSAPRPDSHYAASKLHGEALCRLYAEKCGIKVTVLRIGHVAATLEQAEPACWLSPEDLAQLVQIGLTRTGPAYEVFHAVADYAGAPLAPSRATQYGYVCRRPAEPFEAALLRLQHWTELPEARARRGATFASADLLG